MYKVIELDIDGTLTGDTRIEEIALVSLPAIEQNFIYFGKEDSFIVPQSIASKACKARKYKEENGSSCGTPVGWTRSSQLCDRKPITLETVKRMYSYLSRHKVDLQSSKSYDDGCGLLMYDAWGGEPALPWAEKIVKRYEDMDIDVSALPEYVDYATGDTENDMLIEDIGFIEKRADESKKDYITRCIEYHINKGYEPDQAAAVCYSQADEAFSIGQKVSFDYDGVLTTARGVGLLLHELNTGSDVYIVSARQNKKFLEKWGEKYGIHPSKIFATGSNQQKIRKIKELRIYKHYDDNEDVISELGRTGINFNCSCLDEYAKVGPKGGISPSKKAPKSDTPNRDPKGEGSAKGDAKSTRGAEVSERVEKILKDKVTDFNEKYKEKLGYGVNVGMLKTVYQRGAGAYNTSHSPRVKSAEQWALARVNAFLYLIKNGRPENSKYVTDNDLLPKEHPKYSKEKMSEEFEYVGLIDETPVFSTKEEAIEYGKDMMGCASYHVHTDDDGNEVYMPCEIHPEPVEEQSFGVDEYSDEEKEAAMLLYQLKETDYEKFEAVIGALRGRTRDEVIAINHRTPTNYFKYERKLEGSPDRDFCMSIEDRYFRRLEIDLLRDINRDFGHQKQSYSKWLYKGGPNCIHAWRKFIVQGDVFADQGFNWDNSGMAGIAPKEMPDNGYYNEVTKRKSEIAYIVSQKMMKQDFKSENEKRMIYSPLMIPGILIPRLDENNEKYFVKFKPEAIEKMQQLYMLEKRMDKTNYEHSKKKLPSVVMVESWIVTGEKDKAFELGFNRDDIPNGTWMGGFKVLNTPEGDYLWNEFIKTGKLKGFSVEGEFLMKFSRQKNDEYLLSEIINILNKINE